MRIEDLNSHPVSNLERARGFRLAYDILYNKFLEAWSTPCKDFGKSESRLLLHPLKMIFFRAVELHLRNFLLLNNVCWFKSRKVMNTRKDKNLGDTHDLGKLWAECSKYSGFIDDGGMKNYIDCIGGSTKNYSGAPYSESGVAGSKYDIEILKKLEEVLLDKMTDGKDLRSIVNGEKR